MRSSSFAIPLCLSIASAGGYGCAEVGSCKDMNECAAPDDVADDLGGGSEPPDGSSTGSAAEAQRSPAPAGPEARPRSSADTTPPKILSVSPSNGQLGVRAEANLVIEFSEPMNKTATAAGYRSSTLGPSQAMLSWNDAGTILTIKPRRHLSYAQATYTPGPDAQVEGQAEQYGFVLGGAASDLAGNALTDTSVTFSTLRRVSQMLTAVPSLTGTLRDDAVPHSLYAFLSFDVGELPAGIQELEGAVLTNEQAAAAGWVTASELTAVHVPFAALDASAISAGPGTELGILPKGSAVGRVVLQRALALLFDDYRARSTSAHYSQYRLELPGATSEEHARLVAQILSGNRLTLDYLVP